MITKPFFQGVDDFGRVALACREAAYQDELGSEISEDEMMQCENIQCTDLPGVCRCWCEWCSSILGLESRTHFTLPNSYFNGLVDTETEDTPTGKQLCFGDALV